MRPMTLPTKSNHYHKYHKLQFLLHRYALTVPYISQYTEDVTVRTAQKKKDIRHVN